ncbi:MAG: CPBP family intramembrane metalloprotease [Theionarchaea archaeon]|nr:CPBP family intramembrane metalloprotease [Theionarchaea archaeon]
MSSEVPFFKSKNFLIAVLAALLLALIDLEPGALEILSSKTIFIPDQTPASLLPVIAFFLYLFFGSMGIFLASRLNLPSWWRPGTDSPQSRRTTIYVVLLGIIIVILNTAINVGSVLMIGEAQIEQSSFWLFSVTPKTAVALSLHAAITEEILFRLFIFPLVALTAWYFLHSQKESLVIGAFVSLVLFGLMHPGLPRFLIAFTLGIPVIYIYYNRGLIPAMITHFAADAIPFVIISLIV